MRLDGGKDILQDDISQEPYDNNGDGINELSVHVCHYLH